ncbi:hypothetical protein V6N13_144821 [Hibiscus sabdariffa]|uniref:60S acidic ribosomal protein P2 n=2 Tax=Hibiscus sabdariffa TaxID=183260 RepID=A0ABR1ZT83_9ROSI
MEDAPFHCSVQVFSEFRPTKCNALMKVIVVYLLAVLGGNLSSSTDYLKDILRSIGVEEDDDRIELLLSQVKGKGVTKLIASRREKLASVPSGGYSNIWRRWW